MDCPKCGYALTAFDKDCARCRAIAAEEFAKSPAAVWPPAIGSQAIPAPAPLLSLPPRLYEVDNSSGEERGGPPEIEDLRWNWGAFFCGWLWCFFHRTYGLALLVIAVGLLLALFNVFILPSGYALPSELMAVVLFGLCCYLGMHGHQFAWERRRFPGGVSQYLAVQRAWAVNGAVAFGISLLFCATLVVFFLAAFQAYEARRQAEYRAAHPATAPAPVSNIPAPIVMRPSQPAPEPAPVPMGRQGYDHPGDFQRHFNPNYRREFDPRLLPPRTLPNNVPNEVPNPIPPPVSRPDSLPNPSTPPAAPSQSSGQATGSGEIPGSGMPTGQAAPAPPPAAAPMTGPTGALPDNTSRP